MINAMRNRVTGGVCATIALVTVLGWSSINDAGAVDDPSNFEAYFRAKLTGAAAWGSYERLSYTLADTRSALVASNGTYDPDYVVVVFTDDRAGQYDWYFTESFDAGDSWSTPRIAVDPDFDVYGNEYGSAAVEMADDGIVHMSFARHKDFATTQPTGIYYARYDGANWSSPIAIKELLAPGTLWLYTSDVTVGQDTDTIHLAYGSDYPGNNNGDTWYSTSTDGGLTWSAPVNINQDNTMDSGYRPSLAADADGNVYKANDGGWPGWIWFRRSPDDGAKWNPHVQIGGTPDEHRHPIVLCDDDGGVWVVYKNAASGDLLCKYSTDHGASWAPSQTGGYTIESSVGVYFAELDDEGLMHVVYSDTATGVMEAYYKQVDAGCDVVTSSEIVTPADDNVSRPTGLAVAGGNVYVATKEWQPLIGIEIDIKPGSDPNSINCRKRKGVIPVAALTTQLASGDSVEFDATAILDSSVRFGPGLAEEAHGTGHPEDVDGDGDVDMVYHFRARDVALECDATEAQLTGETMDGEEFVGTDAVRMVGNGGRDVLQRVEPRVDHEGFDQMSQLAGRR